MRRVALLRFLALATAVNGFGACGLFGGDPDPVDASADASGDTSADASEDTADAADTTRPAADRPHYPVETLPFACRQAPPIAELAALDADADVLVAARWLDFSDPWLLQRSDDGGATWENIVVAGAGLAPVPAWTPWGGRPVITRVDADSWGFLGAQWSETGRPLFVYTDDDGATWSQHQGADGDGLTVEGTAIDARYDLGDGTSVAVGGALAFVSGDGGASWTLGGACASWNAAGGDRWSFVDARDGLTLIQVEPRDGPSRGAVLRPGQAPLVLPAGFLGEAEGQPVGLVIDGHRVASVGKGEGVNNFELALAVYDLDTGEQTYHPLARDLTRFRLARDGQGAVWASGRIEDPDLGVDEVVTWRLDPATGAMTEVLADVGPALSLRVVDGAPRGEAGARLIVEAPVYDDGSPGTSFLPAVPRSRRHWLCDVGPDVDSGGVALVTEGTPAAIPAGEAALHALRNPWTSPLDRMALDSAGEVVVTTRARTFPNGNGGVLAAPAPATLGALHEGTSTGLYLWDVVAAYPGGARVLRGPAPGDGGPTLIESLDLATGESAGTQTLPMSRTIYAAIDVGGQTLYRTDTGSWSFGVDAVEAAEFPRFIYTNGSRGLVVDQADLDRMSPPYVGQPRLMRTFDTTTGFMPDLAACAEEPAPSGCLRLYDVRPHDVAVGQDGAVYVLDAIRGRVWRHAPDAGVDAWEVVASGFARPSDLTLRQEAGRDLVYVLDGHVWVFDGLSGEVARPHGAGTPRPLAAAPRSPAIDRLGCREGGPCLTPPANKSYLTWDGDGPTEVCLGGTGLGASPGQLLVHAAPLETSRWSDTEVCFTIDPALLDDGLLQVIDAEGVPSNRLGFLTPARDVTLVAPEEVGLGGVVAFEGANLGHGFAFTAGPQVLGGGGRRVEAIANFAGADRELTYLKLGEKYVSRLVDVPPSLLVGCVAGANTSCEVGGLSLGKVAPAAIPGSGYAVTVGGLPATLTLVEPTALRFEWPETLPDGVHQAVFTRPDGVSAAIEVEKVAGPPLIRVGTEGPDGRYLELASPRADERSDGVWLELYLYEIGKDDAGLPTPGDLSLFLKRFDLTALDGLGPFEAPDDDWIVLDDPAIPLAKDRVGQGARLVDVAGQRLLVEPAGVWAMDESDNQILRPRVVATLPDVDAGWLADARLLGDRLFTAVSTFTPRETTVRVYDVAGDDLTELSGTATLGAAPGVGIGRTLHSPGTYLAATGAYTAPCRNNSLEDQSVTFRAADLAADAWTLGAPQAVWSGVERIQACRALDDGLIFVVGAGEGATVLRHTAAGLTTVATVPASLPGLAEALPELGGAPVQDVGLDGDGDVVLLIADRSAQPQALYLARWDGAAWQQGQRFGTRMSQERGEVCAGPVSVVSDCRDRGLYGCVPTACPLQPLTYRHRAHTLLGEAALSVSGGEALVTWGVRDLDAPAAGYPWGLYEAFLAPLPLP